MRMKRAYLMVTRIIKFQMIKDIAPTHCSRDGDETSAKIVLRTYNGLVPISPKMTPNEPKVKQMYKRKFFIGETFSFFVVDVGDGDFG